MSYTMNAAKYIDLEKTGLIDSVNENIRRNRMSSVNIKVFKGDRTPVKNAKIKIEQTEHDFKFGCNAFMVNQFDNENDEEKYDNAFKKIFNQAVVPFYWRDDEPYEGIYRFEKGSSKIYRRPPADEVLEWCAKYKIQPKAHNMVWLNEQIGLPAWMQKDKSKMQKKLDDRIRILSEKYSDKIDIWDVCNEVSGAGCYEDMPEDYEVKAHILADKLFPDSHLILNDYHGFYNSSFHGKRSVLYQIAKKILYAGGRIDGIGIQHHLFINEDDIEKPNDMLNAEKILNMLDIYSDLGKSLHFSEITIPSYDSTDEKLSVQAKIVENFYRLCFSVKSVKSIVWWNLVDGFAFVNPLAPSWNEDYYGGGLLKHDFTLKPSYKILDNLINREWTTNLTKQTNDIGVCSAEVFCGEYNITIDGKIYKKHIDEKTNTVEIICD